MRLGLRETRFGPFRFVRAGFVKRWYIEFNVRIFNSLFITQFFHTRGKDREDKVAYNICPVDN